jgi:uncharacterized protein YbjT (DUF2867 family)
MITILGATGNIGRPIAETLLARGEKVRVISRTPQHLEPLVNKGAEPLAGSADDPAFLARALSGAKAVFVMIPPDLKSDNYLAHCNRIGEAITQAIKNSGVKNIVNLSSVGADLPSGTGPIVGLHNQEQRLNSINGVNILHLRPTYFMENLFATIGLIKTAGFNGTSLKPDLPIPMIATQDIAEHAAGRLVRLDFQGTPVQELLGPRDVTMNEATHAIGAAIGKPDLKYVQFSYQDAEKGMIGSGLSPDLARTYNEMIRGFNEGKVISTLRRTPDNATKTTIEEFAKLFAQIYNS